MIPTLLYALVLSVSSNLTVVEVYPTLENCDVMASRLRPTMPDHGILVSCWPTTHSDRDRAHSQLNLVIDIIHSRAP